MEAKRITDHRSYKISDEEVVERVLGGEKELYEILLRRHNQTLYRILRSYMDEEDEIEDAMQEVWLKSWNKLHQFRKEVSFSTWLIRIGINEALARIRKRNNSNIYSMKSDIHSDQFTHLRAPIQMNPEHKAIRYETRRLLEQAIDRLPEKYRAVYILREVEEMSTSETSGCLRISESNVKVRLHRAKILLKDILMEMTDSTELFEFGNSRCDNLVDAVMEKIL